MSTPKVRLSNIDRGISVFTAVNTYQSRKLNEQILNQQYKNNNHLSALRSQMSEANAINKQILANQLKAEEHKEAQKYYKALSFNLFETIDLISKIEDKMVLNYVLTNFYDKIKSNVIEANDQLDEIVDKSYNKQSLDKLNVIKTKSDETIEIFRSNVLNKVDSLIADFKVQELKFSSIKKPEFVADKKTELVERNIGRKRTNGFRTFGIVVLGLITAFFLLIALVGLATGGIRDMLIILLPAIPFAIPFIILLRKEIKWRNEFNAVDKKQKQQRLEFEKEKNELEQKYQVEFEKKKNELEQKYQETIQKEKEKLLNHPVYNAMAEISENHPTFDKSLTDITELETTFAKKWGLDSQTASDKKQGTQVLDEVDKKIIELCKTESQLKAVIYCQKAKGWDLKTSKKHVDNLVAKHKIVPKGGCFVATACYGDYDAPEVLVLRQFRDDKLLKSFSGKLFVNFYYSISPFFATLISKSNRLKHSVRLYLLTPIVSHLQRHNDNLTDHR